MDTFSKTMARWVKGDSDDSDDSDPAQVDFNANLAPRGARRPSGDPLDIFGECSPASRVGNKGKIAGSSPQSVAIEDFGLIPPGIPPKSAAAHRRQPTEFDRTRTAGSSATAGSSGDVEHARQFLFDEPRIEHFENGFFGAPKITPPVQAESSPWSSIPSATRTPRKGAAHQTNEFDDMPPSRGPSDFVAYYYAQYCSSVSFRNAVLAAIGLIVVVVVLKSSSHHSEPPAAASKPGVSGKPSVSGSSGVNNNIVPYTCPFNVERSQDDKSDYFEEVNEDDNKNKDKTLADFRSTDLDEWGMPYADVKAMLRPWKEGVFVSNVKSGDSIYESACGIGMNLLLTTEILQEHSIKDVTVYGNDYVSESIAIANKLWADEGASVIANKGRFCRGDPTNLDFIPPANFDFVFTGYIDPLMDPLDLHDMNLSSQQKWELDVKLCESSNPKDKKLVNRAQLVQEEWFSSWVKELIRIAKPGKVIAIENGAESICTNTLDWGGVDKSWWSAETVKNYGWDVDPKSIVIRDEKKVGDWKDTRYHVMMRKNQ